MRESLKRTRGSDIWRGLEEGGDSVAGCVGWKGPLSGQGHLVKKVNKTGSHFKKELPFCLRVGVRIQVQTTGQWVRLLTSSEPMFPQTKLEMQTMMTYMHLYVHIRHTVICDK